MSEVAGIITKRRRGRWSYVRGLGWRLDGTNHVLDFERDHTAFGSGWADRGGYVLDGTEPIDKFLEAAMEFVEQECAGVGSRTSSNARPDTAAERGNWPEVTPR